MADFRYRGPLPLILLQATHGIDICVILPKINRSVVVE